MKNLKTLILFLFILNLSKAQIAKQVPANSPFIKEKAINVQIGYGLSTSFESITNFVDEGFFAQGELVLIVNNWFELRPYVGFIGTNPAGEDLNGRPTNERATTKAFFLGAKSRLRAPIPYIAPYVELGIGTSIGTFETFTAFDNVDKSGIIYHIPVAVGLELGKNHNIDLGLAYLFQPSVEQFAGAVTIGFTFPLR